jgi:hypothetical protein
MNPYTIHDTGGCICLVDPGDGTLCIPEILPDCQYHRMAAEQPWNHHIPWNCPTFWDGCNCPGGPFYEDPEGE